MKCCCLTEMYTEECREADRTVYAETEPRLVSTARSTGHGPQSSMQVSQHRRITLVGLLSHNVNCPRRTTYFKNIALILPNCAILLLTCNTFRLFEANDRIKCVNISVTLRLCQIEIVNLIRKTRLLWRYQV